MYRYLFPIIIIFSIAFTQTDGEVVKNVTAAQRTDGSKLVDIYYDLEDDNGNYTSYSVYVTADWPGMYHNFSLYNCYGDVWENVVPGLNKQITCQLATPYDDETQYLSGDFLVNVHVNGHAVSELPESFEMVEINTDNTTLADYNYEMMKYEVTTTQYVEFLNDKLSEATNIIYQDHDGWPEQEGGETYNRIYEFEDGTNIGIWYSNPGGCSNINCGDYIPNDGDGRGGIYGYNDTMPMVADLDSNTTWTYLYDISTTHNQTGGEMNFPLIQFSSTNICTAGNYECEADFSFFISEGHGNHPAVNLTYYAIDAFADHYGLRIPSYREFYIPFLGLEIDGGVLDDDISFDNFIFSILNYSYYGMGQIGDISPCDYINCIGCPESWECHSYPVGTSDLQINGIYDLLGNVIETAYRPVESESQGFPLFYYEFVSLGGYFGDSWSYNGLGLTSSEVGFRCVRTLSGQ